MDECIGVKSMIYSPVKETEKTAGLLNTMRNQRIPVVKTTTAVIYLSTDFLKTHYVYLSWCKFRKQLRVELECLVDRICIFLSLFFLKILGIKHKCDSSIPSLFYQTVNIDWDSEKKKNFQEIQKYIVHLPEGR